MGSWMFAVLALFAGAEVAAAPDAAAQNATDGARVFKQCIACHAVGPGAKNKVGPELNGLFGRHSGSVAGFSYSEANKQSGIVWDEALFRDYIRNPRSKIPGTKMVFAGLKDEQQITDLIAYLGQFDADGKTK